MDAAWSGSRPSRVGLRPTDPHFLYYARQALATRPSGGGSARWWGRSYVLWVQDRLGAPYRVYHASQVLFLSQPARTHDPTSLLAIPPFAKAVRILSTSC
ncbi:hypothetical protein FA13DRAFT_1736195 [Coprinellus micaceus]|uniref:Uncharacterized protein n=1 Tax=Coprinellus micaceus TaxID=71717 RepID=A0A4Y7T0Q5_COPMI|nr:hypothetical protein FA13DRAFT_1736195 [Coprinellus micaceus]